MVAVAFTSQSLTLREIVDKCGQYSQNCSRDAVSETPKALILWYVICGHNYGCSNLKPWYEFEK